MRLTEWVMLFNNDADSLIWHRVIRMIEEAGCAWHIGIPLASDLIPPNEPA